MADGTNDPGISAPNGNSALCAIRARVPLFALALALLLGLAAPRTAAAHRVNVFAWVEAGTVRVEATFPGGRPVAHGTVVVRQAGTTEVLFTGATDDAGKLAFPVPAQDLAEGADLEITVDAGSGHADAWIVTAAEIRAGQAPAAAASSTAPGLGAGKKKESAAAQSRTASTGTPESGKAPAGARAPAPAAGPAGAALPSAEAVAQAAAQAAAAAVNEALERRLAPLTQALARQAKAGPGLAEIVGGIGWIVGLAGLVALVRARRLRGRPEGR